MEGFRLAKNSTARIIIALTCRAVEFMWIEYQLTITFRWQVFTDLLFLMTGFPCWDIVSSTLTEAEFMFYECCCGYLIGSWFLYQRFHTILPRSCVKCNVCCYLRCNLHNAKSFAVNCGTMTSIINLSWTESISAHNCFIEETKLSSKLFLFNFAYQLQGRAKTIVCARGANH